MATYYKYFKAGASLVLLAVMIATFMVGEVSGQSGKRREEESD